MASEPNIKELPMEVTTTSSESNSGTAYDVTLGITLGLGIPLGLILIAFLGWLYVKYERGVKRFFTEIRSCFSCIFCVPFFRTRFKEKNHAIEMLKRNSNNNKTSKPAHKPRRSDEETGGMEYGKKSHMQTHREFVDGLNNDGFHRVDVGRVPPAYESHYYGYGHNSGAGNNYNNGGGQFAHANAGNWWQPYGGFPGNNGAQCAMM